MSEQQKFLRGKFERSARASRLVPSHVEFQVIDAQMFCLSLWSASQYRTHSGKQFRKRERFHQIIVRAQLESFHTVAHTVARGEEKHGGANTIAPEFSNHFPAILLWQHDIDDEKIEPACARLLQTGFAVARNIDSEPRFPQSLGQKG